MPTCDETKSVKLDEQGKDVVYLDETNNMICSFTMCANPTQHQPPTQPPTPNPDKNYNINMLGLIHTCVQSLATKKIELVCDKKIICQECTHYNLKTEW